MLKKVLYILFAMFFALLGFTSCEKEDITNNELQNSQWFGSSISGWKMEDGQRKNVAIEISGSSSFQFSFTSNRYIWEVANIAGISNVNETGTWSKTDKNINLSSDQGKQTTLVVKSLKVDLTDTLVLVWESSDFSYTIRLRSKK